MFRTLRFYHSFFKFLSTPSARRATYTNLGLSTGGEISIHALREEGDHTGYPMGRHKLYFYPRPPRGGRLQPLRLVEPTGYFYPRPPRGGRQTRIFASDVRLRISIHAHREEGDFFIRELLLIVSSISIHALREEGNVVNVFTELPIFDFYPRPPRGGRPEAVFKRSGALSFLSTPSARRATFCGRLKVLRLIYFYPRPPRGGRLLLSVRQHLKFSISIHALREEGDAGHRRPTPHREISIHALREEGDLIPQTFTFRL